MTNIEIETEIRLKLKDVMEGWQEGVGDMEVGEQRRPAATRSGESNCLLS